MAQGRGWLAGIMSSFAGSAPPRVSPYKEAGTRGTAVFGGYVEVIERDPKLSGQNRYRTASDLLANVSIIAAGVRNFLNLTSSVAWKMLPAEDNGEGEEPSDAAKAAAEFMQSVIDDMDTGWTRVIRRSGMFRFHGFGIHELTAKRRPDGLIGVLDIEQRPQFTIERWELDPSSGAILGVWQRSPQTGEQLWIPRSKYVYLVDDCLTDSPEGMGLFRHLVKPGEQTTEYLKLEALGFERDLRGIPFGRAPFGEIQEMVEAGTITVAEGEQMLQGIRGFVRAQVKAKDTGLIVDSAAYRAVTGDGETVSPVQKWGLELLNASANGIEALGKTVERLRFDMAMILGAEGLLLGSSSGSANRSLSQDKSKNLYLTCNGALTDLEEAYGRDLVGFVWTLNGFPDELRPRPKAEEVSQKDAAEVAATLRDMATAGAVLAPDDPAINDLRDLIGISHAPDHQETLDAFLTPTQPVDPNIDAKAKAAVQVASAKPAPPPAKGKPPAK